MREANKEIGDELDASNQQIEELSNSIDQQDKKLGILNRSIEELKRKPRLLHSLHFPCILFRHSFRTTTMASHSYTCNYSFSTYNYYIQDVVVSKLHLVVQKRIIIKAIIVY